ncbi:MAG TPA: MFS transporter [Chryseosolibacter sp.]|nr:MFS transporter [Chryseosolibacter sp.]
MLSRNNIILLVCCSGIFFEALDIAIVNLAMPIIQQDFQLPADAIQWMQVVYVLCYGGFLVLGGKLADLLGRKKVFIAGSLIFMITSLGAGLSPGYSFLLLNRALQGIGAALVLPSAFSIITNTFHDEHERNKAIGIFGSFAAIGSGSGLSLGGIVATYFGWQWIFFINVPVIFISLIFAFVYIAPDHQHTLRRRPDALSSFLLTSALFGLNYLVHGLGAIRKDWLELVMLLAAVVILIVLFFKRNSSRKEPLIDFAVLNQPTATTGYGGIAMMGAVFTSYLFLISLILQKSMQFTAAHAGFILLPFSIFSAIVSKYIVPAMLRVISIGRVGVLGMVFMLTGTLTLAICIANDYHTIPLLISIGCVNGAGIAICFMAYNITILHAIPKEQHGLASSLMNASFFFAGGLGLSTISLFLDDADETYFIPVMVMSSFALLGIAWLLIRQTAPRLLTLKR